MTGSAGPATPPRARRNVRWLAMGALLIALGGIGGGALFATLSSADTVITITRTVYRDQVITHADLGVVSLTGAAGVESVSADRIEEVVGSTALTDLTAGSLLNPASFGLAPVEAGTARVGLRLAAGRLPTSPLPPGTAVLLVPVGRDGAEPPAGASILARVAAVADPTPDGAELIDVTVPDTEAERVARLAAADQLALVRQAGGSR